MGSKKYIFSLLTVVVAVYIVYGIYYNNSAFLKYRDHIGKLLRSVRKKSDSNSSSRYLVLKIKDGSLPGSKKGLPPVITDSEGGIGNQLFEFACAYGVAKKRNSDLYVLRKWAHGNHSHLPATRNFVLDHFKIPFSRYSNENFNAGFEIKEQHIWEKTIPKKMVVKLKDACASEVYFKDYKEEIKEMFQLNIDEKPVQGVLELVKNTDSVSVHIRRGDYKGTKNNRTLPITYQKRAMILMKKMVPNATFFVISDDLKYVKKEFELIPNVVYVDNSKEKISSLYDFLIMIRCKHNIIANSTYSWWAAYLNRNKDKIIIAPYPRHPPGWNEWFYKDKNVYKYRKLIFQRYLYPQEWLTVNPFTY